MVGIAKVITTGRPPKESHTPPTDRESAEILCSGGPECSTSTAGMPVIACVPCSCPCCIVPSDLTQHKFQGTIMKNFGTVTASP